jgi:hypothetical protein
MMSASLSQRFLLGTVRLIEMSDINIQEAVKE